MPDHQSPLDPSPTCGKCLRPTHADLMRHARDLAEAEWRKIPLGPDGENSDAASLSYDTMVFLDRLATALEAS